MSAGTLTLTNSADAVTGSGTAFTTELAASDFIVVTVGGVPYTLPVKAVNNNTSLTLVSAYTGPTQSGAAWSAVPRVALNMVTAALVAQSAEALRGLNYDKQNWQSIFSGSGNVTVKLPDGSSFTGPAWGGIATTLSGINQSINDIGTTLGEKADKKSLGTAAAKDIITSATDLTQGRVLTTGAFGLGKYKIATNAELNSAASGTMFFAYGGGGFYTDYGVGVKINYLDNINCQLFMAAGNLRLMGFSQPNGGAAQACTFYSTANTTKAADGTLKAASPVVKLFHDGRAELNLESEGCLVTRKGTGEYLIEGCTGLNADAAWGGVDGGFDIPKDRNRQPLIWLDYEVNTDGSVLVKTYHRTYPDAPEFARNERPGLNDGDPVDIPADQFVSVRVEMPQDSIWNQKQEATRIAMVEARMKEERTDGNNV
ncbi:phage tail protein [Salmonella enterica]|nr:phage tail protein [Salmonella enterica subsp. houtenae]ECF9217232.1 phage tail protein [Salmonella enterica]ECR8914071.1 phage tail protein [Salmonella enterica]EEE2749078.1 phage tail protein [Salmonella enterica subsp. houtenae]EEW9937546.1 phage tail protein [Salmonella enterica]